jgi:hypothetical protein
MYDDVLGLLFDFLSFSEQERVSSVCRAWRSGLRKTACLRLTVDIDRAFDLPGVLVSPLAHHISTLDVASLHDPKRKPWWMSDLLRALPHLTDLTHFECDPPPCYPRSLCTVGVVFGHTASADLHNAALRAVVERLPALTSLSIGFFQPPNCHSAEDSEEASDDDGNTNNEDTRLWRDYIDLHPLKKLASLHRLTFYERIEAEFEAAAGRIAPAELRPRQMGVLRRLPSLRYLSFDGKIAPSHARSLCHNPFVSPIEELDLGRSVVDELLMCRLAQLPRLTALHPASMPYEAALLLPTIKHLSRLRLRVETYSRAGLHRCKCVSRWRPVHC